MELSLRLDTLGVIEVRYLRGRERYRDWPQFLLIAASRQARILAYMTHDVAEQLHQQILAVEEAAGLDIEDDEDDEDNEDDEETNGTVETRSTERESFSPAFAQTLERLNELARQRLPDAIASTNPVSGDLEAEHELTEGSGEGEEEDALEQLQDAFVQMMDVIRELAEELSTDALKLTGRLRCARTGIGFTQTDPDEEEDDTEDIELEGQDDEMPSLELELALVLQLFEEGRGKADDLPSVELQLDVDDFERLHETLDIAFDRERRTRRRR